MKLKLIALYLCICLLLISSSSESLHPLKLSSSLIEYNHDSKSIRMECRVFIDDFENTINKKFTDEMVVSDLRQEDKDGIGNFFEEYYRVWVNNEKLEFKYESSEVISDYNVFIVKFSESKIDINKGDKLLIENKLFFEEFGPKQTNRITLRFSPYVNEAFHSATLNNHRIDYNF